MRAPDASDTPEADPEGSSTLDSLTLRYQAQTRFYKFMTVLAVLFALGIGALAGYGVYVNGQTHDTVTSIQATVNRVTNPQAQAQQFQGFLFLEQSLAQTSCRAHGQQLALVPGSPPASAFMAPCDSIHVSFPTPPTTAPARKK